MKEGVEGEARTWTASAGVAGVHGDGGGVFFGSRMEATYPAVSGQKEEGEGLGLDEGKLQGQKWRREKERCAGKCRPTPTVNEVRTSLPERQRASAPAWRRGREGGVRGRAAGEKRGAEEHGVELGICLLLG